jgi:hypothetical protein
MFIVGSISSIASVAPTTSEMKNTNIMKTVLFSAPSIIENEEAYVAVHLDSVDTYLMSMTQPVLPKIIQTFEIAFGSEDISVEVLVGPITNKHIKGEVRPAFIPKPLTEIRYNNQIPKKDESIYSNNALFPLDWYSYSVSCGLNDENQHVTFVSVHLYPVRYNPVESLLFFIQTADISISYKEPNEPKFPLNNEYDLVIIAPSVFNDELEDLVIHKNNHDVQTVLKNTEDIYEEYEGVDKPEQIKYFIKDALETYNVQFVLLVGGLDSMIAGSSRDDQNQGSKDWYVPVRYSNLLAGEGDDPGYISDLYYADVYKEGGVFDSWDSDGNGIFAEWSTFRKDILDLNPDVYLGRLACRNEKEVSDMVEKIISYESTSADESWFKRIITISGDAFQDQMDLDIQWDVHNLQDGKYIIHAQSNNPEEVFGPVDIMNITLDRTVESSITFSEDDHLKTDSYPFIPIAEITSPSEGNILGNSDVMFVPPEAYDGEYWAKVDYVNGIMHVRGKSYDPKPYGFLTDVHVWITDSNDNVVFEDWRNNTEMYYEDEWTTGEKMLEGRGGTLYYMSDDFEKIMLWTSNGMWTGQSDVIDALSEGAGFVHFFGHASPRTWGDQYPGIPGGRREASVSGLTTFDPFGGPPFLPMSKISNSGRYPVVVAGGCHNGQFNVTFLATLLRKPYMWTYGVPIPECWSWWLTRLPDAGAIATISNTGMGYGLPGKDCIVGGLNGWLDTEFFRLYSDEEKIMLGETYAHSIRNYIGTFEMNDPNDGIGHVKAIQEWTLLGDPSLRIGGYP